jgi:hypothetical protein
MDFPVRGDGLQLFQQLRAFLFIANATIQSTGFSLEANANRDHFPDPQIEFFLNHAQFKPVAAIRIFFERIHFTSEVTDRSACFRTRSLGWSLAPEDIKN